MWAALKTDFREFVSTVAEESSTALSAIDAKIQSIDIEGGKRSDDVVVDEDGNVIYENDDEDTEEDTPLWELILATVPHTDDEEIPFDGDDLLEILRNDEVQEAYALLVPEKLTRDEFYTRYVTLTSEASEEEEEDGAKKVMTSVMNFAESIGRAVAPIQGGPRPPFVLNTALDEDDEEEWEEDNAKNNSEVEIRLKQLEEEHAALHQTVELQRKELEGMHKEKATLTDAVSDKERELTAVKAALDGDQKTLVETIGEREATISRLEREADAATAALKQRDEEGERYKSIIKGLEDELSVLREVMSAKDAELADIHQKTDPLAKEVESLKRILEGCKTTVTEKDDDTASRASPNSMVKVNPEDAVKTPPVSGTFSESLPTKKVTDDEEDDWGDAWGDEEDDL